MANLGLVLLAFAFVVTCISMRISSVGGWALLPMGIAFWIAAHLLGGLGRLL